MTSWWRPAALVTAVVLGLSACTGDADEPDEPDTDTVVIEHQHGTTEIADEPERVVSLGYTDADPILALGVVPVAVRPGYGVDDVGPWAEEALGDAEPEILGEEIDIEQIAALDPDLIVAVSESIDAATYDLLDQIAPTVVRQEGYIDYGVPWAVATEQIGKALGRTEEARQIIEDTTAGIADSAAVYPRVDGSTGVVARANPDGGWYAYTPADARGQFLTELGIQLPPALARRDDAQSFYLDVSEENTTQLEADVLLAIGTPQELRLFERSEVFQQTAVVEREAVVEVPYVPVGQALSYTTVLSIPYALEQLLPQISAALD